ncbi:MAG: hypothetical protein ACJA1A_001702 [Saprospiraceae bacterium]|jgi:hypothetical protein|tara:strand:+ start:496 stop:633 length:138 start_codon:yes stop_codon:yes gene_type:complete
MAVSVAALELQRGQINGKNVGIIGCGRDVKHAQCGISARNVISFI